MGDSKSFVRMLVLGGSALFLGAACSSSREPVASTRATASPLTGEVPLYLHGAASPLSLSRAAPTASVAATNDSAGIHFSGGNVWTDIATWSAAPPVTGGALTGVGDAQLWLGLKN